MIRAFQELFKRLGWKRQRGARTFYLDADLHAAILKQVGGVPGRVEQMAGELVSSSLRQIQKNEEMKAHWQGLSPRQQDVTALTCLGYTNRQIAARLGVAENTVKSHVKNTLVKFQLHGKLELQTVLADWDFSEWDK